MMLERLHVCVLPVILVVFYYVVPVWSPVLDGYVSTCPTPSEIKERSLHHTCPENKPYHIVRDPQRNKYKYGCFESRLVPAGYATVMDKSGNLNTEACHEGTFQRHSYKSNTQCACMETKGHCNETGQVVASNGSTTEDRTCRCDFRRGYKFSIKPSNECFCQSSSEDCTCKKIECETGYRLSPDYECVPENLYSCKDFITSEESTTESVPDSDISVSLENTTVSVPDNNQCIPAMTPTILTWIVEYCLTTISMFFCGLLLGVVLERKTHISGIYDTIHKFIQQHRPCRNGQASTKNAGKQDGPVQVTGKQDGPVQVTENDDIEISPLIKVDKPAPSPTNNNQRQHTVI